MDYLPNVVEQVTRTMFPNYFKGSEIIVVGKLVDREKDWLNMEVTASNNKKFVTSRRMSLWSPGGWGVMSPGAPGPKVAARRTPTRAPGCRVTTNRRGTR